LRKFETGIISVRDVFKAFHSGKVNCEILKGVSLTIDKGEFVSIMGPSGSGKSTLFNMIAGLDFPSAGAVYIDEVNIANLNRNEMAWLRCTKIGYIFQSFNVINIMTAWENVLLPMLFAGVEEKTATRRAIKLLKKVGLENRIHHKPQEMSTGEKQRVSIARAFANNPAIVLADEPTGILDLNTAENVISILRNINKEEGVTIISVTRDMKMLNVSDRVIWLKDGQIDRIEKQDALDISIASIGDSL
jgi:putative ABC transport system ATP-binding protein